MGRRPPQFDDIKGEYRVLWDNLDIRPKWTSAIDRRAKQIIANKDRYEDVEARTGVPWWMVGCIHSMESGLKFSRHLHNGDSLSKRTWRVPARRPKRGKPPFSWEFSADDALKMKGWHKINDWSIERVLYETERYNGWGYRLYRGIKSPYLWSGSGHYRRGKYVADGKWSKTAVSGQTGAACLMKRIHELEALNVQPETVDDVELEEFATTVEPVEAEQDDPTPIPKAIEPNEPSPVEDAAKGSKTIFGALIALFGMIVQWMQDGVEVVLEAAKTVTSWSPAQDLFATMGGNVASIGFGLGVFGIVFAISRRVNAAAKGKIG